VLRAATCSAGMAAAPASWAGWPLPALMVSMSPAAATANRNVKSGQATQMPLAATALPNDAACAIELRITLRPRTSATPYQEWRSPTLHRPGSTTTAGKPATALSTAARTSLSRPAQYESYFDATPPVCSTTSPKGGVRRPV